jgi:hypothetical protein
VSRSFISGIIRQNNCEMEKLTYFRRRPPWAGTEKRKIQMKFKIREKIKNRSVFDPSLGH